MGYSSYVSENASLRSKSRNYESVTKDSLDTYLIQNKEKRAHHSMMPNNMVGKREARDSEAHPNTLPIQLYIDVTGSMMEVPVYLIKKGLNHIASKLLQVGINDATILIAAIGDHECDMFPLQIGQFESGDEELDMWLTRIYTEKGGGGNTGESYLLAWQMASQFVETDAWDKRKQKGFVFTIGDEPTLLSISSSAQKEVFGSNLNQTSNLTAMELVKEVEKKNNTFHIHVQHQPARHTNMNDFLGQRCLTVHSPDEIGDLIVNTIINNYSQSENTIVVIDNQSNVDPGVIKSEPTITL